MASLLDLPNEILIPIVDLVYAEDTEDIVSLSSCNKHLRLWSEKLAKKHKEMREQYKDLEIGTFSQGVRHAQSINAGLFLNSILKTGNIALYPTKLRVGTCYGQIQSWEQDVTVAALNDCLDEILAKIHASPYIERGMK